MTSCVKLSDLLKTKLKIAIQVPKTHIYILFRVLSATLRLQKTNLWPSSESHAKS